MRSYHQIGYEKRRSNLDVASVALLAKTNVLADMTVHVSTAIRVIIKL